MAMADGYGLFWNSDSGDRKYDAQSFEKWLKKFFTSGVFEGDLQVLASSGMTVQVQTGYSNVNGKVGLFESATNVTLSAANSRYSRIDTIIIERNDANRVIQIDKVTGAYTGDNPQPTAPIWDETQGIYQLVLAQIYVRAGVSSISQEDIIDKRTDTDVCGYIAGTVNEMDFSQFAAQFESYYEQFVASNQEDFETWFDEMKDQLSTDAAGHLQAEIDALNNAKAPKNHASTATTYGAGDATKYGHVKLSDSYSTVSTSQKAANSIGASAWALQTVNSFIGVLSNLTTTAKNNLVAAINEVNTKVSKTKDLISNSSDAYSTTKAYAVGDLCIHDDTLQRCITPCSAGSWATNQSCFTQVTLVNVVSDIDNSINAVDVISEINISNYTSPANTFNIPADGYLQLIADANVNNVTAAYIMPSNKKIATVIVTNQNVAMASTFFVKKGMEFYFYLSEKTYSKVLYYKLG
jgi:hypothetical protein